MRSRHSFLLSRVFLAFVTLSLAAVVSFSQASQPWSQNVSPLPAPTGFVNDYAGVVDAATKQQLETKLKDLKDTTDKHVEIAVAVVKTTGERPIFDYSLAVARGWKIGSKADDNPSALLLIAIDDRKYFTQVSKDLEDELPDGLVGSLQRQYLVPEFKKQNYSKGISDTIDAYIAAVRNKSTAAAPSPTPYDGTTSGGTESTVCSGFCCLIIVIIIILVIVAFMRGGKGGPSGRDKSRWGGGAFGANDSSSSGVASALPWIIGGILSGGSSGGSSSSSDWGSSSGGGSDWGGFGGGGDFGGGGAGGDW